jgi:hypothetical protein
LILSFGVRPWRPGTFRDLNDLSGLIGGLVLERIGRLDC